MSVRTVGWCIVCTKWQKTEPSYSVIKAQGLPVGTQKFYGCTECANVTVDNYPMIESLWADRRTGETVITLSLCRTKEGEWVHPQAHRTEGEPNVLFSGKHGAVSYTLSQFYHRFKPMIGIDPSPPTKDIRPPSDPDRKKTEMSMSSDEPKTKPDTKPSQELSEDPQQGPATPRHAAGVAHVEANGVDLDRLKQHKLRVYIAGPMNSSGKMSQNIRKAVLTGMLLRRGGHLPFVPHLHWFAEFMLGVGSDEFWLAWDFEELSLCAALIRLPGESSGSDREVEFARKNGIPVFHGVLAFVEWADITMSHNEAVELGIDGEIKKLQLDKQQEAHHRLLDIRERHGTDSDAELALWKDAAVNGWPAAIEGVETYSSLFVDSASRSEQHDQLVVRLVDEDDYIRVIASKCTLLPPHEHKQTTYGQIIQEKPSIGYSMSMDEAAPLIEEAFGGPIGEDPPGAVIDRSLMEAKDVKWAVFYAPSSAMPLIEVQLQNVLTPLQHEPLEMWVQNLVPLIEEVFRSGASALQFPVEAFTNSNMKADEIGGRFKIGAGSWKDTPRASSFANIKDILRTLAGRVRKDVADQRAKER